MPTLPFTIDAELLRELGERLVGKPHIALAELVKNSYDADATDVTIKFAPNEDSIEIIDNGHGMTAKEFEDFWMRIGTVHKTEEKQSKNLGRPLTGSKGVGRLAVQFLANKLTIKSFPIDKSSKWIKAEIDWEEAIEVDKLTEVEVMYNEYNRNPSNISRIGTTIILSELKQEWEENLIGKLAADIWWLQPPFRATSSSMGNSKYDFRVNFESTEDYEELFKERMEAIKGVWIARLVGKNINGKVKISLEFPGEDPIINETSIEEIRQNQREANKEKNIGQYSKNQFDKTKNLNKCYFEIRIYNLWGKQKFGIKVDEAREYFKRHGGVHVYDSGFRLPYYGSPESDWLKLEYDHSHRRNASELLPKEIQAPRALNDLPTLGRVLGSVHIDTADEHNLEIMITRDRLAESVAYEDLVLTIRYAIHRYANETAKRKLEAKRREKPTESTSLKFERVEEVLEHYEPAIPKNVYQEVYKKVQEATTAAEKHQELVLEQMGLLAPLATAGISALSYQHELKKQFAYIDDTINKIKEVQTIDFEPQQFLSSLSADLASWLERAKATNLLFDYIADVENTQLRNRFRAISVIEDLTAQTRFLARGTKIDYSQIDNHLYLPKASFAEWGAIFQNVFINAFNAMLDSPRRLLHISSRSHSKSFEILIQDTGYGIDLQKAEKFFDPFERESKISVERQALGYGGTGLGLTIVRLIADNIDCRVQFIHPQDGFSTAFSIQWRETK